MNQKNVLILERSSENLKKVSQKGKTILEGVFAEFGIENRNGRIYQEKEYLPHLEYLKKDIQNNNNLLGELDHPDRFEVALANVSHRIIDLWYDQEKRQVKGKIEVLEGTPKGQIAKSLLDAGVPLSISSRAAGTVNEDKTVSIQQIYTYDLVAKPGFENAELHTVNESVKARINNQISKLNESYSNFKKTHKSLNNELGFINENLSIYDLTDKYPALNIREEAMSINKINKNNNVETTMENLNEETMQKWTLFVKKKLSEMEDNIKRIENAILENKTNGSTDAVKELKQLQEQHLAWTGDLAKAINKVAKHSQTIAEKSNQHYDITKKISETVDYNAKVLNHTQDWVGKNAEITNVIAETVDHNAKMLNGLNEWNKEIATGVNALHEWGTEKAKAINDLHDWTSTIAKNVNESVIDSMSKDEAKKLIEYIELVSESKTNPELKLKLDEMLSATKDKTLVECLTPIKGVKGLGVITDTTKIGDSKVDTKATGKSSVKFDTKTNTITVPMKAGSKVGGGKPKELKTLDSTMPTAKLGTKPKIKGIMTLDVTKTGGSKSSVKISGDGPTNKQEKEQNLKLDTKPVGKLKESNIIERRSKLTEKLDVIINNINKEKKLDEQVIKEFPFTSLLTESDRKAFSLLTATNKEKVANEIAKNPTTDPEILKNLMESAVTSKAIDDTTPIWLKAAPEKYKSLFESATEQLKGAIKARAEFYDLNTQYQINNFWETSGLNNTPSITLNEVFVAKTTDESEKKMDDFVSAIGEQMKKYNK